MQFTREKIIKYNKKCNAENKKIADELVIF